MNYSNLPVVFSKDNFTNRFVDYSNVYVLPSICYFGCITSLISVMVTFKREDSHTKTLNYIFLNSTIDFLFLLIQSFLFIIRCGVLCPYGYSFPAKFYEIYIYLYAGYILLTSQVLLNIYVSYDRYKMFSTKKANKKSVSIFKIYLVCALISIVANAFYYLISKEVIPFAIYKPDANSSYAEVLYKTATRPQLDTPFYQHLLAVITIIKDPLMFFVLCISSVLVCIKYRAHFKVRRHLIQSQCAGKQNIFLLHITTYTFLNIEC